MVHNVMNLMIVPITLLLYEMCHVMNKVRYQICMNLMCEINFFITL